MTLDPKDFPANTYLIGVCTSTGESLAMNHPDWHPISCYTLILDAGMYSVDVPRVCRVTSITKGSGNAAHATRNSLCKIMEGGFLITDELSPDSTMAHGIGTVN